MGITVGDVSKPPVVGGRYLASDFNGLFPLCNCARYLKFGSVVLEKDVERHLDGSCEK